MYNLIILIAATLIIAVINQYQKLYLQLYKLLMMDVNTRNM